jgi:GT2 family glycosyltransferase
VEAAVADVAPRFTVVVPFLNSIHHLQHTAPAMVAAARAAGAVEIIFVDNGSRDGSREFLDTLAPDVLRVIDQPGTTIAAMRNAGARQGAGSHLSFIDTDVGIDTGYFHAALDVLAKTGADATGCEYALPPDPVWIERTLHDLHYVGRDRFVLYINSGNFIVRRHAFEAVGGFREDLRTGEDSDLGHRLVNAGFRIFESTRVAGVHYGNAKTLREHYRRTVWQGIGMFATVARHRVDRAAAMLLSHMLATVAGIVLVLAFPAPLLARVALAILLQGAAPAVTVLYRMRQTRRIPNVVAAVALYWVYYTARMHAAALIALGRSASYRK